MLAKLSHVHRRYIFRSRRFFKERVGRLLTQAGFKEVLKLREHLIQIGSKLDF